MTITGDTEPGDWRLDRRVPAMLLLVLALQVGTALVWAGAVGQRINRLESAGDTQAALMERTVRLEEKLRHTLAALGRIEGKLDRIETAKHLHSNPD